MITTEVTLIELASLMKKAAGVSVDPEDLEKSSDSPFGTLGLDSSACSASSVSWRTGTASRCPRRRALQDPREFLDLVNNTLKAGA